jgi:hypothetical protein
MISKNDNKISFFNLSKDLYNSWILENEFNILLMYDF